MDEVQNKLNNPEIIVKELKTIPHTYKTLLKEKSDDGTCQFIIRRKLNILLNDGEIYKTKIPGTRYGIIIYYSPKKTYHILVEGSRLGSITYFFYKYKKLGIFYIKLDDYWLLGDKEWIPKKDKLIFEGNVLLFI